MPYNNALVSSFLAAAQAAIAEIEAKAAEAASAASIVEAAIAQARDYARLWADVERAIIPVSSRARELAARAAKEPLYREAAKAADALAREAREAASDVTAAAAREFVARGAIAQASEAGLLGEALARALRAGVRRDALAALAAASGVKLPATATTAKAAAERPTKKRARKAKAKADKPAPAPAQEAREAGLSNRVALMATWAALQKVATRVERAGDGLARVVFSRLVAGRREIRGVRAAAVKAAAIQAAKAVGVKGRRDAVALANDEAKAWAFAEAFVKALAAQKK